MRLLLAAIALCSIAALPNRAAAVEYPWCVYYMDGDVSNCGFASAAQCRMALSGNGGFCQPNPSYVGVPAPLRARPARSPRNKS